MEFKHEGPAFPPVPLSQGSTGEAVKLGGRALRDGAEPRCEMCGHEVIATHCKRICVRCGFMTGCSEGI